MTSELFSFFTYSLSRPEIDSDQSTRALWTDPHISAQMLRFHLDPDTDAASYRHEVIDRAVDWMYRHFALDEASSYLDLGCGPGLYTQRMAELGVDVTGIDFSERSLQYAATRAAERGSEIAYRHESYLESELTTQADLITMISCDMSALTSESLSRLLENVSRWLSTNGAFVFDFHSIVRFSEARERHSLSHSEEAGFYAEQEHLLIESRFVYEVERATCDKYTIVTRDGGAKELYLWHRYYTLGDMMAILGAAGMYVAEVYGSIDGSDFAGTERDITVVARKHPDGSDEATAGRH
jgi:2-polyprenyl-3-methyl-5-hydroxy-6-metoxy-1,4-benzoquinol methylase